MDHLDVLRQTRTILLIDYPGRVVPDTLARAGYDVTAHEGPGPERYHRYRVEGGEIVRGPSGAAPAAVDLVFSHRPLDELEGILEEAVRLGARALWQHEGLIDEERRRAEALVTAAGLTYIDTPFILDVVSEIRGQQNG